MNVNQNLPVDTAATFDAILSPIFSFVSSSGEPTSNFDAAPRTSPPCKTFASLCFCCDSEMNCFSFSERKDRNNGYGN